jgi:hypothetical protein
MIIFTPGTNINHASLGFQPWSRILGIIDIQNAVKKKKIPKQQQISRRIKFTLFKPLDAARAVKHLPTLGTG